jgi:integrase
MGRRRKERRQQHGSAWHWQQTDAWYYTMPGTKKRVALFDEQGRRIKGKENQALAEIALAKAKVTWGDQTEGVATPPSQWLVAKVCSDYLQYCERGLAKRTISKSHYINSKTWLNDLCAFCGGLPVPQLKKGHVQTWVEKHTTWKSEDTQRGVLSVVLAAFNRAEEQFNVPNPLKGLKKPSGKPRLHSIHPDDEKALYESTEPSFRNFLFTAIHTGLRPYCELATITADEVEITPRGMMWRVYSSKTKKTRKIPVRPEVAELVRQLLKTAPKGSRLPLFRNTQGKPWQRMTGVVRFIALKAKLGWDLDPVKSKYSSYSCRHTFAHRMLSGFWSEGVGCSIETLAELMGDTPKVAFDHYGKEWGQHYQDPLWNAIGEGVTTTAANTATKKRKSKTNAKTTASRARSTKPR